MRPSTPSAAKAALSLARRKGLLRARDLKARGLPTVVLTRLIKSGEIERVARGVYRLPDRPLSEHQSLAEVALRVPRGVVCLLSALRVYDIGTQAPFEVWLAIPNHLVAPKLDRPALRIVRMSDPTLANGIERVEVDGVAVPVFSAAKTVADCFKFRNKIGMDVALEALHDGWRKKKFTMDELHRYAALDRVANVMRPYLESLVV